jgi:hypothetical protein
MARRLLNIASIVCLVLCVALMGMWVRSYWRDDGLVLGVTDKRGFIIGSMHGIVTLYYVRDVGDGVLSKLYVGSYLPGEAVWLPQEEVKSAVAGFRLLSYPNHGTVLAMPHWFPLLLTGSLSAILWTKRPLRFTLLSLFMVTTILAILLGIITWLARWMDREMKESGSQGYRESHWTKH